VIRVERVRIADGLEFSWVENPRLLVSLAGRVLLGEEKLSPERRTVKACATPAPMAAAEPGSSFPAADAN
jgi:hypothetical protein